MKNAFKTFFLIQTFQFFIVLFSFYLFTESDFIITRLQNYIFILLSYILFLLLAYIPFYVRPLKIHVSLRSNLSKDIDTTVVMVKNGEVMTPENHRTIYIDVTIERRRSIWNLPFIHLINKNDVFLRVIPIPNHIILTPFNFYETKELERFKSGFQIKLNNLFTDFNTTTNSFTISKSFSFRPINNPGNHIPHDLNAQIIPHIFYDKKKINWISLLVKKRSEQHRIYFKVE